MSSGGRAAVAHHDGNLSLLQEREEDFAALPAGGFHVGGRVPELIIRRDDAGRIYECAFCAQLVQARGKNVRRHLLAQRQDHVHHLGCRGPEQLEGRAEVAHVIEGRLHIGGHRFSGVALK